jgi:hypothetical protein
MRVGEREAQGPLPRDQEHVNPDNILEDPPRRGVLPRWPCWVGKSGSVILQRVVNAILPRGLPQQAPRHHQHERHDPRRRFAIARGGQHAGGFEKTPPACRQSLALIAC